jgi:hypothetical protein
MIDVFGILEPFIAAVHGCRSVASALIEPRRVFPGSSI